MIRFKHVCKQYPNGYEALVRVTFHLPKGEMAFLTGHSGAGKSTFLSVAGSLEAATRGQVIVNDTDLMSIAKKDVPAFRRNIGIVLQDPYLLLQKTVHENVALPLIIGGLSKTDSAKRVRAALDKVGLLEKANFLAEELSAGESQRVALARAIVNRPVLILADEPTGNLDPDLSKEIFDLFSEFNRAGSTILIASHDVTRISKLPYEIIEIAEGRLVEVEGAAIQEGFNEEE
jgi:cell division transport system ATP-binding protein